MRQSENWECNKNLNRNYITYFFDFTMVPAYLDVDQLCSSGGATSMHTMFQLSGITLLFAAKDFSGAQEIVTCIVKLLINHILVSLDGASKIFMYSA